jgi:hypothetical protein
MTVEILRTPVLGARELETLETRELRDLLSALSRRAAKLQDHRPRPLKKLYGLKGPTPEQLIEYKAYERAWNAEYRAVMKMHKLGVEISNRRFRAGET